MELWVEKVKNLRTAFWLVERKERNRCAARTDLEKSHGEKEGDGVRVLASDTFPFPGSDPLKHPLGPQDTYIFVISNTIKKISMAQGNVRVLPGRVSMETKS